MSELRQVQDAGPTQSLGETDEVAVAAGADELELDRLASDGESEVLRSPSTRVMRCSWSV